MTKTSLRTFQFKPYKNVITILFQNTFRILRTTPVIARSRAYIIFPLRLFRNYLVNFLYFVEETVIILEQKDRLSESPSTYWRVYISHHFVFLTH